MVCKNTEHGIGIIDINIVDHMKQEVDIGGAKHSFAISVRPRNIYPISPCAVIRFCLSSNDYIKFVVK